jgi:Restriction endonuclease S subunits
LEGRQNQEMKKWELTEIKTVASINEKSLSTNTPSCYEFTYLDLSCVDKGIIIWPTTKIQYGTAPSRAQRILRKNDVMMAMVRPNLQAFAFVEKEPKNVICSTGFALLSPKKNVVPKYLYQSLYSSIITKQIDSLITGSNYPAINSEEVGKIKIPLPPLPEQRKIAEILSCWDKAKENVSRSIQLKKDIRKNLSEMLFRGDIRLIKFGKPRKQNEGLPIRWILKKASTLFSVRSERNNKNSETVLSVTQDAGIVSRESLERKINMDKENTGSYKLVMPGDFIISLRSFQGGLEFSNLRGLVSPAYHVIKNKVKLDHNYFRHYFKSYEFIGRLATSVIGIRDGKQVSYNDFSVMEFPFPPLEEQVEIGKFLNCLDNEIAILNKQLKIFQKQFNFLMIKLLSGKEN